MTKVPDLPATRCNDCARGTSGVCFKHKIRSIQWGTVPGAYRRSSSTTYYDREALDADRFPTTEEVRDTQSDVRRILREADD